MLNLSNRLAHSPRIGAGSPTATAAATRSTNLQQRAETARTYDSPKLARRLMALREHMLMRDPSRFFRWLDAELSDNPRVLCVEKWPRDAHLWRAHLQAACMETVPLGANGSPDPRS